MSRPRKPFGANQPGRLPATMMKVLAAEMSDPARLRRGKQYAKDGSVVDIVIEQGVVTCEVLGSRSTPYIASIEVTPGDGMPLRRDVNGNCTCPDAEDVWGTAAGGTDVCKHVVAAMFTFSDELLLEPELLDVWRGRNADRADSGEDPPTDVPRNPGDVELLRPEPRGRPSEHRALRRRHLRLVTDGHVEPPARPPEPDGDPLEQLLGIPEGAALPEVPVLEQVDTRFPNRRELASVMRDALAHLHIEWD